MYQNCSKSDSFGYRVFYHRYFERIFYVNESNNNYVSLVRIPRKWFNAFVWTFSGLVILHLFFELVFGWRWKALGETVLTRMSALMTLIVGWFFIISHTLEGLMLGRAKLFRERVYAEGKAAGKAEARKELFDVLRDAQQKGIPLEEALETYAAENNNETNATDPTADN